MMVGIPPVATIGWIRPQRPLQRRSPAAATYRSRCTTDGGAVTILHWPWRVQVQGPGPAGGDGAGGLVEGVELARVGGVLLGEGLGDREVAGAVDAVEPFLGRGGGGGAVGGGGFGVFEGVVFVGLGDTPMSIWLAFLRRLMPRNPR